MEIALYPCPSSTPARCGGRGSARPRSCTRWREWTADGAGRGHLVGAHHADAADPGGAGVPARPQLRDDRRRDPRRPRVRRRGGRRRCATSSPEIDTFDMVPPVALSRLHNDPEEPMPVLTEHRLLRDLPAEAVDAFLAIAGPDSGSHAADGRDPPPRRRARARRARATARSAKLDGRATCCSAAASAIAPEMVAGLKAALPRFKAAMARVGRRPRLPQLRGDARSTHARSTTRSRTAACAASRRRSTRATCSAPTTRSRPLTEGEPCAVAVSGGRAATPRASRRRRRPCRPPSSTADVRRSLNTLRKRSA